MRKGTGEDRRGREREGRRKRRGGKKGIKLVLLVVFKSVVYRFDSVRIIRLPVRGSRRGSQRISGVRRRVPKLLVAVQGVAEDARVTLLDGTGQLLDQAAGERGRHVRVGVDLRVQFGEDSDEAAERGRKDTVTRGGCGVERVVEGEQLVTVLLVLDSLCRVEHSLGCARLAGWGVRLNDDDVSESGVQVGEREVGPLTVVVKERSRLERAGGTGEARIPAQHVYDPVVPDGGAAAANGSATHRVGVKVTGDGTETEGARARRGLARNGKAEAEVAGEAKAGVREGGEA